MNSRISPINAHKGVIVKISRRTTIGAAIASASVFALVVTGCSSPPSASTDTKTPITLTLATFNNFGYTDALLAEYHKLHPNITVVQNKAATSDAAETNLFTKLAAGSGLGDVEAVDGDWMPKVKQYASKFVDLTAADNKGRYSSWKTAGGTVDGKQIGLGTDIGPEAICYRSDLFAKAGLPTDPAAVATLLQGDWQHYYDIGAQFAAKKTGAAWFDSAGATFQGLANQYQNFFEKNDGTVVATTNPDVKAAFTSVLQASATDSAHLTEWTNDWSAGMAKGAWATMLCPPWMLGVIQGDSPKATDWKIANVFPNGGGNWGGSFLLVPTQGKHTAEAKQFVDWLTAPAQQIQAFKTAGNFPSQVAAYSDATLTGATNPFFNNAAIGQIFIDRAKAVSVTPFKGVKYGAIMTAVQNGLTRVEQKQQTIDASWTQVVSDITALG
ncbi:MAG TPA: ABC transporter substrate-binding protein [Microbacteriaceae bacterium]|nr:ABC transporter substrate-binding protein [Microbacteriaceae bacterium]